MKRALVSLVVLAVALWTCVAGRHALVGRADAADDPLTTEMRKQIGASLIVFVGEVAETKEAPGGPGVVSYKVERYLKGTCFESVLNVAHEPPAGADPAPAAGTRVVVGAQLVAREPGTYALQCTSTQFAPVAWTQALEDAVLHYVSISPSIATVRKPPHPASLQGRQQRLTCMNNLSQLGQIHLMQAMENRAKAQKYSGPAMWLAMRKNAEDIRRGDERVLLCPCDAAARVLKAGADTKAWDEVDLNNPAAGLCSYAGRDFAKFPIDVHEEKPQAVGACLHHAGGAVVVFDGGDAQYMTLEELGLSSDAEKTVGPDSKSPVLRVLK